MKRSLITCCALLLSAPVFSQITAKQETFNFIFSKLSRYTTQVNVLRTPYHQVLFDPKITQWEETITFETPDKTLSFPMKDIRTATVNDNNVILTGPNGEATVYMDTHAEPRLKERLESALDEYIERSRTKEYTVYEYTEQ
ncbi:MAG: hypothetical protein JNL13_09680 [Chitinophagaceae bacterium]|nr:hypothetical protein [Chitinophagaceae bacterium]